VHTPLLFQHKGNACWFLVSICCLLRPKQLSALGNWFETSSIEGACLHVWVKDSVDLAEQGAFALCAGRGLLAQLGFLAVQELLMPLIDLLLATHQVVLPQDDIALVILYQQPADIAHHEDQKPKCNPAQLNEGSSGGRVTDSFLQPKRSRHQGSVHTTEIPSCDLRPYAASSLGTEQVKKCRTYEAHQ